MFVNINLPKEPVLVFEPLISPLDVKFVLSVIVALSVPTDNNSVLPLCIENTLFPLPII